MRVGIDATCWSNPRGYGRYARGLLTALLSEKDEHEYILFVDSQTRANWQMPENVEYMVVPTTVAPTEAASADGRRSVRDLWAMSAALRRTPLDLFYYPSVYTFFPAMTRAKVALGVHDVIAEDYAHLVFPNPRQRWLWTAKSWLAHRQADYIITVSDHAGEGITRRFGWPKDRMWIVGEAPDPVFRPIDDPSAINRVLVKHGIAPNTRFLVCLGGLNPHKNLGMLFEALADLRRDSALADVHLALVGPAETDSFTPGAANARQSVNKMGLESVVHFTGYLPDDEVAHLLNAAQALVMPSFDEGYGLGAVEAAACGTPVIATQSSPLPRLLEGGGLFIDPRQPSELKAALVKLLSDETLRQPMGQVALERARLLTWQRAADQFHAFLAAVSIGATTP